MGPLRRLAPWTIAVALLVPVATDAQTYRAGDAPVYRRTQRGSGPPATLPNFPECVRVRGEVRYRVGYEHIVSVTNDCSGPIHCDVSSTVDPTPLYPTDLAPGEHAEIQTRRGSAAIEFQPRVVCRPK